jgi:ribose 5-phosphate isomerase RpiB
MSTEHNEIEAIVRAVAVRLARELDLQSASAVTKKPDQREWVWSQRVLGTRELSALPQATTQVLVCKGAIVTHAAREWLTERNIELAWKLDTESKGANAENAKASGATSAGITNAGQAATAQLTLVVGATSEWRGAAPFIASLRERRIAIQQLARTDLQCVVREVADLVVFSGFRGLLLTDNGWLATTEANRVQGVRAAWCREPRDGASAERAMRPNIMIVNPSGWTMWNLLELTERFAASARRGESSRIKP